ncbi:MAG: V-type ATP synthase subunit E [bacterium]|nr:MAG: V-type ATP synthase subunit E [bacterium]
MNDERRSPPSRQQLVESLWRDARREADGILAQAQTEGRRIEEDAHLSNERILRETLERTQIETGSETARILNLAANSARRHLLQCRYSILEEGIARLEGMLAGSATLDSELRLALPRLLAEALEGVRQGAGIKITVHPADEGAVGAIIQDRGMSAEVIGDPRLIGGAVVAVNNSFEIRDNSVLSRLQAIRETPPLALLKELFGGSRDGHTGGHAGIPARSHQA